MTWVDAKKISPPIGMNVLLFIKHKILNGIFNITIGSINQDINKNKYYYLIDEKQTSLAQLYLCDKSWDVTHWTLLPELPE